MAASWHRDSRGWILAVLCLALSACGEAPPPRTSDEIFQERLALPALYFTAQTNQRVIAPGDRGIFVDEKTGEICFRGLACLCPDCPGKNPDGTPFVFAAPDPALIIQADGSIGSDQSKAVYDETFGQCPRCLETRNLKQETGEQRRQFIDWVQPHVLPENVQRMAELDAELQARGKYLEERRKRKRP